ICLILHRVNGPITPPRMIPPTGIHCGFQGGLMDCMVCTSHAPSNAPHPTAITHMPGGNQRAPLWAARRGVSTLGDDASPEGPRANSLLFHPAIVSNPMASTAREKAPSIVQQSPSMVESAKACMWHSPIWLNDVSRYRRCCCLMRPQYCRARIYPQQFGAPHAQGCGVSLSIS